MAHPDRFAGMRLGFLALLSCAACGCGTASQTAPGAKDPVTVSPPVEPQREPQAEGWSSGEVRIDVIDRRGGSYLPPAQVGEDVRECHGAKRPVVGWALVEVELGPEGQVVAGKAQDSEGLPLGVIACLERASTQVKFEPPEGGSATRLLYLRLL